jgi:hypothetical protein
MKQLALRGSTWNHCSALPPLVATALPIDAAAPQRALPGLAGSNESLVEFLECAKPPSNAEKQTFIAQNL